MSRTDMKTCVYCESPDIKKRLIVDTNLVRVFPTNIPVVPGHVLITPKRCVATLEELSSEELQAFLVTRREVRDALIKIFGAEGFNYAWNEGTVAGQSVLHLHLHVLPRKMGDTGITEYEPRKFLYRPGSREETPEAELGEVARMIRDSMN